MRIVIGLLLLLTSCVTPYQPPTAGPTATIQVQLLARTGRNNLDLIPAHRSMLDETRLLDDKPGRPAMQASFPVTPGVQRFLFGSTQPNSTDHCDIAFAFNAAAAQTYIVYIGTTAPAAPVGPLGNVIHYFHPSLGAKCFVNVQQRLAGNAVASIHIVRWLPST